MHGLWLSVALWMVAICRRDFLFCRSGRVLILLWALEESCSASSSQGPPVGHLIAPHPASVFLRVLVSF